MNAKRLTAPRSGSALMNARPPAQSLSGLTDESLVAKFVPRTRNFEDAVEITASARAGNRPRIVPIATATIYSLHGTLHASHELRLAYVGYSSDRQCSAWRGDVMALPVTFP